jgi:predicted O-linked N-acetylglucosamine transferase (SPINDLY family)
MGVPVVCLAGGFGFAGSGASILHAAGIPEFLGNTVDEYVGIAASLAQDPRRLAELREGMREHIRQSPFVNGEDFARRLERAYREMWVRWCNGAVPAVAPPDAP